MHSLAVALLLIVIATGATSFRQQALFVSHGGPWDVLKRDEHITHGFLRQYGATLTRKNKPNTIVIISGHDESQGAHFIVSINPTPHVVHDYYPPFEFNYNAKGDTKMGYHIQYLLNQTGLKCSTDIHRGMDHGVWTILASLFPDADVPVVTLSMSSDYDPEKHIKLGQALQPLRDQGVLIIGSGQTTHNLMYYMQSLRSVVTSIPEWSSGFTAWLNNLVENMDEKERNAALIEWEKHPFARMAHPTPDHFVPFLVVAGTGTKRGKVLNDVNVHSLSATCYAFES